MWEEILKQIVATGVAGFLLFLLGYSAFAIVKRGKLKRQKREAEIRQIENAKFDDYIRNMDNDLKKEIEAAIAQAQQASRHSNSNKNADFQNMLTKRIMNLIEKGVGMAEKGVDIAAHKINEKHKDIHK